MKRIKCMEIYWRDACSNNQWTSHVIDTSVVHLIGFFIEETRTHIALGGTEDVKGKESGGRWGQQFVIPKISILSKRVFYIKRKVFE